MARGQAQVEIRPLTEEDVLEFFGGERPWGLSVSRAWGASAVKDGRVIGIGGVLYRIDGGVIGFINMKDELRRYPIFLRKAVLAGLQKWRDMGHRTLRITVDTEIPRAREWAASLGFTPLNEPDGLWFWRAE